MGKSVSKRICEVCGKPYHFAILNGTDLKGNKWCKHDNEAPGMFSTERALIRHRRRTNLVRRHHKGTLPKSYYSINKEGKPYLSPHKLKKHGY